jgi:hypothetical protein
MTVFMLSSPLKPSKLRQVQLWDRANLLAGLSFDKFAISMMGYCCSQHSHVTVKEMAGGVSAHGLLSFIPFSPSQHWLRRAIQGKPQGPE